MNSAEEAEVTAIKTIINAATAPPFPIMATAALGSTRPADTSSSVSKFGYEGNAGVFSRATQARPIVVDTSQGTANQARPPKM
ncbi:hypothetical protein OGATHE_001017 [Ogataea polymorpha]|uniref:Uncharacterized protein n=1 Tax=Ogataea polymorpha TaxID=460523 RepID=A0A9P8PSW4_9ASCO|nr:hypothetical protein OGATHE_001017 [Ogataea polymorpha]